MNKTTALCFPNDDFNNGYYGPTHSEYEGELSAGPFKFRSRSQTPDNVGAAIGGAMTGGAIAIGAVAVVLAIIFGGGGGK